jgi:glutathione S-transferase
VYTLFHSPGSASMPVHLALLEIGVPYELRRLDLDAREHKDAEYLKLNPNGLVPTLIVDGRPLYETAALLMLLAERHPEAKLAPLPGTHERGVYLQWMLHLADTVQAAFRLWFHPHYGGPSEAEEGVKQAARTTIEASWDRLDAHLAEGGPYIMGSHYGVIDMFAIVTLRWSRNMPKPATQWPALAKFASKVKGRSTWKRLYKIDGLTEWA